MIDEFLYQYQDFCRYKHDVDKLSPEERELLSQNPEVWKTENVLNLLTSLVKRSNIASVLKASNGALHGLRVLQALGYFSLFGLCRLQVLMADYRLAVQSLNPIDIDDKRSLFTRVPACHINLFYYLGFAYMMMRRYADAVGVFSAVLLAHRGVKDRNSSFGDSQIPKRYDQIRSLTSLCISLSQGVRVDQQVHTILQEKEKDSDMSQMLVRGDEKTFEKLFSSSCPKFINPSSPNYNAPIQRIDNVYRAQLNLFLSEVRQQKVLPTIRSYLKLYTSIPIEKLARFCDMAPEHFREHLLSLKRCANQVVHEDSTPPLEGKVSSVNDTHFYIEGDMVYVGETRAPQRHSQYFLTHALKFQQAIDDLEELKRNR
jgi:translation initiation factor 3 subunit L